MIFFSSYKIWDLLSKQADKLYWIQLETLLKKSLNTSYIEVILKIHFKEEKRVQEIWSYYGDAQYKKCPRGMAMM